MQDNLSQAFPSGPHAARAGSTQSGIRVRSFLRVAAVVILLAAVAFLLIIHRFLAVSRPTGEGILVVEAWIPSEALPQAAQIFQSGSYRYLVVVGSQISTCDHSPNYADLAAESLAKLVPAKNKIVRIAMPYQPANHTFATANGFKRWFLISDAGACCIDVYTVGVHARKSWITFESVLGSNYRVGVIAGPETSYNPKYWLVSRRGLWIVARNLAGYLYTKYEIAAQAAPS